MFIIHMWGSVHVIMCMSTYECGVRRLMMDVFLYCFQACFFVTWSLTEPDLDRLSGQPRSDLPGISDPSCCDYRHMPPHPIFCMCLGPELRSSPFLDGILPTEPSSLLTFLP